MTSIGNRPAPSVAIVGGGLAGLAAAAALVERGCRVEIFEARRKLGGRAGSYFDPAGGEWIDHCQHVALGCCTNFLDFCRRTGVGELFQRHTRLHFFDSEGRRSNFQPSRWLPAPLHLAPALLALKFLGLSDKLGIARTMLRLVRLPPDDRRDGPSVLEWLKSQRQSTAAVERFWQVVLVSALGESLDRASLSAARKVFFDGFLAHRAACHVLVPRTSLAELYDGRVAQWLAHRGVAIHLGCPVAAVEHKPDACATVAGIRLGDGRQEVFDFVILAVPWRRIGQLLSEPVLRIVDPAGHFARIDAAPITGLHLWFDRPITDLPHAVLVGRLSQWLFARPSPVGAEEHYYQVVISASRELAGREQSSVLSQVLTDLRSVFPAARSAALLRWRLVTEREAVFSPRRGQDEIRPRQATAVANLFLAGDWTATAWPATMEGAVRSGYLAAEALLAQIGRPQGILAADLPRGWLVRLIAGGS